MPMSQTDHNQTLISSLRKSQQVKDFETLATILDGNPGIPFSENADLLAIAAVSFFYLKRSQESGQCLKALRQDRLTTTASKSDFGLALLLCGQLEEAESILESCSRKPDADFPVFARLGAVYTAQNQLVDAAAMFNRALAIQPDQPELISNIGGIEFRLGNYQNAVTYYDRALELRADMIQTKEMRSKALLLLDRADELIDDARLKLDENPEAPELHLHLSNVLLQSERWVEAEATLAAAVDRFPDRHDIKRTLINHFFDMRAFAKIGNLVKGWIEDIGSAAGDDVPNWMHIALNKARIEAGFLDAAEESLETLSGLPVANEPGFPVLKAKLLIERGKSDESVNLLFEVVGQYPGNLEAVNLLAHTLTSLGRIDEAEKYYDEVSPGNPMAVVRAVEGKDYNASPAETQQMKKLYETPGMDGDAVGRLCFVLSRALEKQEIYDEAFSYLNKANELVGKRFSYDWKSHRQFVDEQIAYFTHDLKERLAGKGHPSSRPIFVTGMPRSGTTLTEQIICSHPEVYGAGELSWIGKVTRLMPKVVKNGKEYPEAIHALTEKNLKSAGNYYLNRISELDALSPRVVDKMPHNFDHIGLIALMFPNAVIIHMDRDPRDVAVSNYYQNFAASQGLMGFAYDLEDIGHMLNDHIRIMDHWHELFPDRIYELNYQKLVSDTQNEVRRLLAFCRLSWDDRVLEFYKTKRPVRTASIRQVRKGIYTSSKEKWRRYERFLDPLNAILETGYSPLKQAAGAKRNQNVIAGLTSASPTF